MPPSPDLAALLDLAHDIARDAGRLLAARRSVTREVIETKSSVTDMVTEVDRNAEALIVGRLLAARPDDAVLAEEGGGRAGTSGVRWVIDPLDGTTNYLYGFGAYAVSIAAELDGETVVGVVHDAARGETFSAALGAGARLDGEPITTTSCRDLGRALVATGFGYGSDRRAEQAAVLTTVLPRVRDIRRAGAAALDLCWVACGRLDGYYERGLAWWDLAAGSLIVREAGGFARVTTEVPHFALAATPGIVDDLRALLVDAGAITAGEV